VVLEKNTMTMDEVQKTDTGNSALSSKTFRDEGFVKFILLLTA
jgi:hypothetical protein